MVFMIVLLAMPAVLIFLVQKIPFLERIGVVALTFLAGFIIATCTDLGAYQEAQITVQEISVALALPLILFSANIVRAVKNARGALVAMVLALVSVVIITTLGVALFAGRVDHISDVAGMAVGAYTGSGINMGAIKVAINASDDLFLTMITYDIIFSMGYMLIVVLFGQRLAEVILRPYTGRSNAALADFDDMEHLADDGAHGYNRLLARNAHLGSLTAFGAAIVAVALSLGVSAILPAGWSSVATILLITTFGIIGSLIPQLHRLKTGFHLGMYLILVFCISSATMIDTAIFTDMDWALGGYFGFILVGSMVLHALLCRLFDIDRDTYLIASGAAIMSVPFIPVIAGALKNRELLVPGIAIAIIGYAIGNYFGVLVAGVAASVSAG